MFCFCPKAQPLDAQSLQPLMKMFNEEGSCPHRPQWKSQSPSRELGSTTGRHPSGLLVKNHPIVRKLSGIGNPFSTRRRKLCAPVDCKFFPFVAMTGATGTAGGSVVRPLSGFLKSTHTTVSKVIVTSFPGHTGFTLFSSLNRRIIRISDLPWWWLL